MRRLGIEAHACRLAPRSIRSLAVLVVARTVHRASLGLVASGVGVGSPSIAIGSSLGFGNGAFLRPRWRPTLGTELLANQRSFCLRTISNDVFQLRFRSRCLDHLGSALVSGARIAMSLLTVLRRRAAGSLLVALSSWRFVLVPVAPILGAFVWPLASLLGPVIVLLRVASTIVAAVISTALGRCIDAGSTRDRGAEQGRDAVAATMASVVSSLVPPVLSSVLSAVFTAVVSSLVAALSPLRLRLPLPLSRVSAVALVSADAVIVASFGVVVSLARSLVIVADAGSIPILLVARPRIALRRSVELPSFVAGRSKGGARGWVAMQGFRNVPSVSASVGAGVPTGIVDGRGSDAKASVGETRVLKPSGRGTRASSIIDVRLECRRVGLPVSVSRHPGGMWVVVFFAEGSRAVSVSSRRGAGRLQAVVAGDSGVADLVEAASGGGRATFSIDCPSWGQSGIVHADRLLARHGIHATSSASRAMSCGLSGLKHAAWSGVFKRAVVFGAARRGTAEMVTAWLAARVGGTGRAIEIDQSHGISLAIQSNDAVLLVDAVCLSMMSRALVWGHVIFFAPRRLRRGAGRSVIVVDHGCSGGGWLWHQGLGRSILGAIVGGTAMAARVSRGVVSVIRKIASAADQLAIDVFLFGDWDDSIGAGARIGGGGQGGVAARRVCAIAGRSGSGVQGAGGDTLIGASASRRRGAMPVVMVMLLRRLHWSGLRGRGLEGKAAGRCFSGPKWWRGVVRWGARDSRRRGDEESDD